MFTDAFSVFLLAAFEWHTLTGLQRHWVDVVLLQSLQLYDIFFHVLLLPLLCFSGVLAWARSAPLVAGDVGHDAVFCVLWPCLLRGRDSGVGRSWRLTAVRTVCHVAVVRAVLVAQRGGRGRSLFPGVGGRGRSPYNIYMIHI